MAVLVKAVQQRLRTLAREERGAVKQRGGCLDGGVLGALGTPQYLFEVEAQEAAVRPLAALDQHDLAEREQEQPARRAVLAENPPGNDVFPVFVKEVVGRWRFAVELQGRGMGG